MKIRLCLCSIPQLVCLIILFYALGVVSATTKSTQELINTGHAIDDDLLRAEISQEKSGNHQFTLRYAFYHDMQNVDSPPELMAVDTSVHMVTYDADGQPTLMRPLEVRLHTMSFTSSLDDSIFKDPDSLANDRHTILGATTYPDITDRDTIINLAKMTSDAYIVAPGQPEWLNTTLGFNHSYSFGWKGDGLRGHIFSDLKNKTIIVVFKGTSVDPRDKWQNNDRVNDNILFSCCCGDQRPDPYPYGPVCGCRTGTFQCNSTCLAEELLKKDRYYPTAMAVMHNVSSIFPNASFWTTGHSMGGAMASLMGQTFDLPSVTFESPPERLPAKRLGLKTPRFGPYHFGNTADPIFMGACNGWSSSCSIGGYAFESQCFTGKRCQYDTMADFGWHLSITNHQINTVITKVLEKYDKVATCEDEEDCVDCFNWNYTTPGLTAFY